jgi:predicted dienelactone hydrolase
MVIFSMKHWILSTALVFSGLFFTLKAQAPSFATPGPFAIGERSITFQDATLASSNLTMKVYYPGTSAGTNVAVASGIFPGIAFGHGFNLTYTDYNNICGHLASYGYVVMSPDVQNGFTVSHLEFARELAACLKHMQNLGQDNQSAFFGKIDTTTGVFGHSMGGGASGLVHTVYPDIDAVSGLSAADTDPSAIAALSTYSGPFQAISGSQDNVTPEPDHQIPMYQATTGLKHNISITGGAHCKYTDATTICDLVSGGGSITRSEQIFLAKKYVTAFFQHYLKQDANAWPYICGDSLNADVAAQRVTFASNYPCSVSVDEAPFGGIAAWPNPAQDLISLEITTPTGIKIAGIDGKIHYQNKVETAQTMKLDVSKLPRGVYLLQIGDQKPKVVVLQ